MTVRRFLKAGASLLALVSLLGSSAVAYASDDLATILGSKVIRVGAVSAAPWYLKDLRSNQWTGLVPDLVQAVFQGSGVTIDYVDTQWGTAVAGLQSDRFDLLGGFNKTPERAKAVDFSRPIGSHRMGVLTLEQDTSRYQRWDSINQASIRLAAIDGSAAATLLQPRLDKTQWVIVPSSDAMQLEVESGRANAFLTNDIQMAQYVAKRGRGHIVYPLPVQSQATNFGLRKDREAFRAWLDKRLDELDKNGTLARIWAQYVPTGK